MTRPAVLLKKAARQRATVPVPRRSPAPSLERWKGTAGRATDETALRPWTFELPDGWAVAAIHGGKWPNVDLLYRPGPSHRCRVWLTADARDIAAWLWPILRAIQNAPVPVESHVFADRPPTRPAT